MAALAVTLVLCKLATLMDTRGFAILALAATPVVQYVHQKTNIGSWKITSYCLPLLVAGCLLNSNLLPANVEMPDVIHGPDNKTRIPHEKMERLKEESAKLLADDPKAWEAAIYERINRQKKD